MNFQTIEQEVKKTCKNSYKVFGHDDLMAAIVTELFLSPKELSMEELSEITKYSLPSISLKMKILLDHPVGIRRISKPGTKKAFFFMEKDILKMNLKRMQLLYEVLIKGLHAKLLPISKEYSKVSKTEEQKQKTKIIEQYLIDLKDVESAFCCFESKLQELIKKRNKH